jgi:hypothetical protein
MVTFRRQLEGGDLIEAYQGLMAFFRELRSHFKKTYPHYSVPSNIYYGYLDMTYFAVIPPALKPHKLKIAIVFDYEHFRFEVWLSGANRKVQARVWNHWRENPAGSYRLADDPKVQDYVLADNLVEEPDFNDLTALKAAIEQGTLNFISNIEGRLSPIQD